MLKVFADKDLKTPVDTVDFEVVEAGKKGQVVVYLHNDSDNTVQDLDYSCEDKYLTVVNKPDNILAGKTIPLTLVWAPLVNSRKALKTEVKIGGCELIRP